LQCRQSRKEFKNISFSRPLEKEDAAHLEMNVVDRKKQPEYQLGLVKAEFEAHKRAWDLLSSEFSKEIRQLKEEKQKLIGQISHVGVKHLERKQEYACEVRKAEEGAAKLGEENVNLRKKADRTQR
jgi:hypothetical protein